MVFEEPGYQRYLKATKFARFRYKYGIFVLWGCVILLICLIFFMIKYSEELVAGDIRYCVKKTSEDLSCVCSTPDDELHFFVNSTRIVPLEKNFWGEVG